MIKRIFLITIISLILLTSFVVVNSETNPNFNLDDSNTWLVNGELSQTNLELIVSKVKNNAPQDVYWLDDQFAQISHQKKHDLFQEVINNKELTLKDKTAFYTAIGKDYKKIIIQQMKESGNIENAGNNLKKILEITKESDKGISSDPFAVSRTQEFLEILESEQLLNKIDNVQKQEFLSSLMDKNVYLLNPDGSQISKNIKLQYKNDNDFERMIITDSSGKEHILPLKNVPMNIKRIGLVDASEGSYMTYEIDNDRYMAANPGTYLEMKENKDWVAKGNIGKDGIERDIRVDLGAKGIVFIEKNSIKGWGDAIIDLDNSFITAKKQGFFEVSMIEDGIMRVRGKNAALRSTIEGVKIPDIELDGIATLDLNGKYLTGDYIAQDGERVISITDKSIYEDGVAIKGIVSTKIDERLASKGIKFNVGKENSLSVGENDVTIKKNQEPIITLYDEDIDEEDYVNVDRTEEFTLVTNQEDAPSEEPRKTISTGGSERSISPEVREVMDSSPQKMQEQTEIPTTLGETRIALESTTSGVQLETVSETGIKKEIKNSIITSGEKIKQSEMLKTYYGQVIGEDLSTSLETHENIKVKVRENGKTETKNLGNADYSYTLTSGTRVAFIKGQFFKYRESQDIWMPVKDINSVMTNNFQLKEYEPVYEY
ncbi:MAG: hypothetical protein ABIH37_02980 [archaeon]